jgi:HPt (histidine-containing phosphotransfer) domain-containing protein
MLSMFISETRSDLELLAIYLKEDLHQQTLEMVHKLAGRIGQVGAEELSEKLREKEKQLMRLDSVETVKPELEQLTIEVMTLLEFSDQKIEDLQQA